MTLDTLLKLWPVFMGLVTLGAALGTGRYALGVLTDRIDTLTAAVAESGKTLTTMGTTVSMQAHQLNAHTEQDRQQFERIDAQLSHLMLR